MDKESDNKKPKTKPNTLCMAPWVHTYLSPQSERRMCCASREKAQNFKQYIDTEEGTGLYNPLTLEEHWNSDHMRSVRRRMMAGETLSECDVCNNKLLNTDVYRDYFWHLFKDDYDSIWEHTDSEGYTTLEPVSWDYRFSNLCNFKCRMCGDMLSSAWESEERKHNMINWADSKNNWMLKDVRGKIKEFTEGQVTAEFFRAVREHRCREVYWVGGEPLLFEQHWDAMKMIIEQGDGANVYARYNTNLSQIEYKGTHLFRDILVHIRDWQICASIDGTGKIGEYIRDGLEWDKFLDYYKQGLAVARYNRQMRLDFTLTLPGLFELKNMFNLSKELNTTILSKVVFAFSPDIMMSPLMLPRSILEPIVQDFLKYARAEGYSFHQQPLIDVMTNLLNRPTFEEEFPDTYKQGMWEGKQRIERLEVIRNDTYTLADILRENNKEAYDWYINIP